MSRARSAADVDWECVAAALDDYGASVITGLLPAAACAALAAGYADDHAFRSRIVMARHGFGRGEYKYFGYPLPAVVAASSSEGSMARKGVDMSRKTIGIQRKLSTRIIPPMEKILKNGCPK